MPKLIILGTSNAVASLQRENTHMALVSESRTILVDCASNPILRFQRAGLDVHAITDLVLTHFHPDHVSGAPLLLMDLWLMGYEHSLNVYGFAQTLDRIEALMDAYAWKEWPNFFPVVFHRIPMDEKAEVMNGDEVRILSSPAQHYIPNMALRYEFKRSKKVCVYSCDTEPCGQVARLAAGADVLFHEATGAFYGHSSAAQASEIANQAGVKALYLIHYPTEKKPDDLVNEASQAFGGPVKVAKDFMELEFD